MVILFGGNALLARESAGEPALDRMLAGQAGPAGTVVTPSGACS
jgi:hypothetical protein